MTYSHHHIAVAAGELRPTAEPPTDDRPTFLLRLEAGDTYLTLQFDDPADADLIASTITAARPPASSPPRAPSSTFDRYGVVIPLEDGPQ